MVYSAVAPDIILHLSSFAVADLGTSVDGQCLVVRVKDYLDARVSMQRLEIRVVSSSWRMLTEPHEIVAFRSREFVFHSKSSRAVRSAEDNVDGARCMWRDCFFWHCFCVFHFELLFSILSTNY